MSDWWQADPVAGGGETQPSGRLQVTVRPSSPYADAIAKVESGGRYDLLGPRTRSGDQAYGKYQVMGANVPSWTKEVLGQELTPQQFLASPEAQDAVFNAKFGGYAKKYGPEGAARAWFAGEGGMNDPNRKDILGTSVADYARKFNAAGGSSQATAFAPEQSKPAPQAFAGKSANWWDADPVASAQPSQPDRPAQFAPSLPDGRNFRQAREGGEQPSLTDIQAQAQSPVQQMNIDRQNQEIAASQRTTPNIDAQRKNIISSQVIQDDGGNVYFRDPNSNQIVPTDKNKHNVLIDPADGKLKVFARDANTDEGAIASAGRFLMTGMASGSPTRLPAVGALKSPTKEALFTAAKQGYEEARNIGAEIKPSAAQQWSQKLQAGLNHAGLDENLAPKTFGILSKLNEAPEGATMTIDNLQSLRRTLGNAAGSIDKTERMAASQAKNALDEFLANLPQGAVISGDPEKVSAILKNANANYAAASRAEELDRKVVRAQLRAAASNSGMNVSNTIRQRVADILVNPNAQRGFSSEELAQMKTIVEGTKTGNAARLVKNIFGGGGGLGTLAAGGIGAAASGGIGGVALALPGVLGRIVGDFSTGRQIGKLSELIRSRSPLGQSVEKSGQAWSEAAQRAAENPNGAKIGTLMMATRNLSNNLKAAGVEISPQDLLRSLQSPMKSAAEGDQPEVPRIPAQ